MANSKNRDSSSDSMKKKNALEDLDIAKDFFTSWKSMSMAEEDGLDFDLASAPKCNKKPFDFDKADMDFNLDGDFGKISSFNMDMSDLDISPPLKKDGKSKEKAKESSSGKDTGSSFNMDMSDLDFSPPLKKDGKSMEKPKESSSGKSKGKADRFAFTFDFDELENFSFDSSLEKEGSKAQNDKNRKENSPDGSDCQHNEIFMLTRHMNVIESTSIKEDGPQKPSLPEKHVTFDMGSPLGGSADLELTRKICHSKLAVDDAVTTVQSAAVDEVASDKAKTPLKTAVVSMELPNNSLSMELVSPTENDAMQELPSDSNNGLNGANSSEAQNKVDSMHRNGTGSNSKHDANMISVAGATCNYNHALSEDSQHLQVVAISENINNKESQALAEANVIGGRGKPALGQTNSLVENPCTNSALSEILSDSSSGMGNPEPASEIQKLPLIGEQADISNKQTAKTIKPLVNSSRPFIQPEKSECTLLKVSKQTMISSLSSKKMGFPQPSLVEGRSADGLQNGKKMNVSSETQIKDMVITKRTIRQWESSLKELDTLSDANATQSEKKLVSLSLQHSKTPLSGVLPQIQSQENCNRVKTCGEMGGADGLKNGKKMHGSSEIQIKAMVKTKPAIRQRELSMKEPDTLSSDINKKAAKNSEKPSFFASIPSTRKASVEEHRLSSSEGGKKTTDFPGLKLTSLSLDSTKSPIQKDGRNSSQKSVLLRKTPSDIARFLDIQKQTPSKLSMKRTLEDAASANNIALHPSKRPSQSPSTIRTHVETTEKVIKLHHMEDSHIKSTNGIHHVTETHIPHHEMKTNGMEIALSIQNDGNIKLADAYSKELDDLCNLLRKKHDEAKEILARAIVNSNKLLMLHSPQFEERIRSTQDLFGRLTINSIRG